MSNFKHTPVNYRIVEHNWSDTSIVDGEKTICRFDLSDCYDEDGNPSPELEEVEANIKLIASAPELLEALMDCISVFDAQLDQNEWYYKKAKEAIKKATS